jgi:predicted aldo/keto reductase-like oxidoreductase
MRDGTWNRREFIVKPLVVAGAAGILSRTELLLGKAVADSTGPLLTRTLGKTGIKLPIVSMGVMNADVPGILRRSYELGIRHFDTAAVYQQGRNEEMVGDVIKELGVRDKVIISTKQAVRNHRMTAAEGKRSFMAGVEASLQRLQMDHVDILYYHAVDSVKDAQDEGPLLGLQELKKQGKTRFIGFSTHRTVDVLPTAMQLNMLDVFLVTLNYTMAHDETMLNLIKQAAESGIGIVAMKTQAGGTVRPDAKLPKNLPPHSQTALLKWVLNHEFVTTAIPGFSTYEHLDQDFTVVRNLAYTEDEKAFLADKSFAASAEFCYQCGECRNDCPKHVDVPALMRSHMYAVQYRNTEMARLTLAELPSGRGVDACRACKSCSASCRKTVQIGRKISQLRALAI